MKLVESIGSVCTDKRRYDAVISRLPLASHAFDAALKSSPPQDHHLNKGLLTLRMGHPGDRACETQLQVNGYSLGIFDLSPILYDVLASGAIKHELSMLSGYDVVVDDSYPSFVEPVRHAKKTFTSEEIQRINDEEKQRALLRQLS